MAKSLVEKYEQILSQDPASTVFVELAKALIEKGDNPRAIEVCAGGLEHHPDSVVGRVLWGKALINQGRPAEAMEQFDKAIAINRDNPHAYNLIGEVLLHKGLYRSALPLLRKAAALQPNDGRVRQWLEQTQAALAGGPAPVLSDITQVDAKPVEPALSSQNPAGDRDGTEVGLDAYAPDQDAPPTEKLELAPRTATPAPQNREIPVLTPVAQQREIPVLTPAAQAPSATSNEAPSADDPFAAVPKRTSSSEVMVGLTATFDALSDTGAPPPPEDPFDAVARRSPSPRDDGERGATVPLQGPASKAKPEPVVDEPSISVSQDLLGDLPPPEELSAPKPAAASIPVLQPAASSPKKSGGGLLGDIPDLPEPTSSLEVPKVEVSATAAEAIAREYERELRQKLEQSKAKKSFLAKHWLKLSAAAVLLLVVGVGAAIYVRTLRVNQGSLQDALADAKKAIAEDTRASYGTALEALERARRMDDGVSEGWALEAYARGILYAEHGERAEDRQAAEAALNHAGVKEDFPELALAASYYLADAQARADQGKELIASPLNDAEVTELSGRLLLEKGDSRGALQRFQAALADEPANVRVLAALGDYYRVSGDFSKALEFYKTAGEISPRHPARVLGAAESRLELGQDLSTALTEVEALPADDELAEPYRWRKVLARGRLLAATGKPEKAIDLLTDGAERFKPQGYEFQLALGDALRRAGKMADAQDAFEAALKLRPRSEDARESLIRVLVDRDRPREALNRVPADLESRRISLARGVAWAKAGDWKRARGELDRTQVNGKFPSEAVIYLALADSAEGEAKKAQTVLEKTLAVTRKARSEVLVALGDIHLAKGELDKAKARYEEASKEPDDVEGACAYGRLLLRLGFPQLALEPLTRAAKRNDSHNEAQEALARAYLQTGRLNEALALVEHWKQVTDKVPASYRLSARALYQAKRVKEADKDASLAIRYDNDNPDGYRLRAAINFAEGDSKGAFRDLEKANKLDPKDSDTFCEIGHAFLRAGNTAGAVAAFDAAVRENEDSPCGRTGEIYVKLPSASRSSIKVLEKLARDSPAIWDKAFAEATRSRVLLATGRPKEAKAAAETAVKLAPWNSVTQYALALADDRLRDPETTTAFAQAVALDPANGPLRLSYADHLARGTEDEQAKALDEYQRFLHIGGNESDVARVKKTLTTLKKRLASR